MPTAFSVVCWSFWKWSDDSTPPVTFTASALPNSCPSIWNPIIKGLASLYQTSPCNLPYGLPHFIITSTYLLCLRLLITLLSRRGSRGTYMFTVYAAQTFTYLAKGVSASFYDLKGKWDKHRRVQMRNEWMYVAENKRVEEQRLVVD